MKFLLKPVFIGLLFLLITLSTLPSAKEAQATFTVTTPSITGSVVIYPLQSFVVTATGFSPNELASLFVQRATGQSAPGTKLTPNTTTADDTGTLVYTITLPSNTSFGDVNIRSRNSNLSVNALYSAEVNPIILINTDGGAPGANVTVRGHGFDISEIYTVTFVSDVDLNLVSASCVATTTTVTETVKVANTNSLGSFSFNTTVPEVEDGEYDFVAVGEDSQVCAIP